MKIAENISKDGLTLRNYNFSDMEFASSMWNDEENGRYMSDPTKEYMDDEYRESLLSLEKSEDTYYFILEDSLTKERIGTCCAYVKDSKKTFDIGCCINKKFWKKKMATKMLDMLLSWIREMGAEKVVAEIADLNQASKALVRKAGFVPVKVTKFKKWNMPVCYDSKIYELRLKK